MIVTVILIYAVLGYLAIGAMVSFPVVFWGLSRVDPVARGASLGVRLILWPGSMVLWPMILVRAIQTQGMPPDSSEGVDES